MPRLASLLFSIAACSLSACAYVPKAAVVSTVPVYQQKTAVEKALAALPAPGQPIPVAVYGFADQTGQFKQTNTGQNLSRAVSQGGGSMLIRSLQTAGQRKWFTVIEREQLKDLLNERQIIREMRAQYLGEKGVNPNALPALLFAGVIDRGWLAITAPSGSFCVVERSISSWAWLAANPRASTIRQAFSTFARTTVNEGTNSGWSSIFHER